MLWVKVTQPQPQVNDPDNDFSYANGLRSRLLLLFIAERVLRLRPDVIGRGPDRWSVHHRPTIDPRLFRTLPTANQRQVKYFFLLSENKSQICESIEFFMNLKKMSVHWP